MEAQPVDLARPEPPDTKALPAKREKFNYIGAPAVFALDLAARHIRDAFGGSCYVVGSALERPDWRDVDVRLIMDDSEFESEFPGVGRNWQLDSKWLLLTTSISKWLSDQTGLPVDFQFQPQNHVDHHESNKRRDPIGFRLYKEKKED
jgi:hypothetical protein